MAALVLIQSASLFGMYAVTFLICLFANTLAMAFRAKRDTAAAIGALAITPDGRTQRYDKRHPVPGLEDHYTPGHASGWLGDGRAVEICKDMDFPYTVRPDGAKRVRLIGCFGRRHGHRRVVARNHVGHARRRKSLRSGSART